MSWVGRSKAPGMPAASGAARSSADVSRLVTDAEGERVGHRFAGHAEEVARDDAAGTSEVAHHEDGAGTEQHAAEPEQAVSPAEPDEGALEQHVGAVAHAGVRIVREREGQRLIGQQQRQGEEQAVARRARGRPVGVSRHAVN